MSKIIRAYSTVKITVCVCCTTWDLLPNTMRQVRYVSLAGRNAAVERLDTVGWGADKGHMEICMIVDLEDLGEGERMEEITY